MSSLDRWHFVSNDIVMWFPNWASYGWLSGKTSELVIQTSGTTFAIRIRNFPDLARVIDD